MLRVVWRLASGSLSHIPRYPIYAFQTYAFQTYAFQNMLIPPLRTSAWRSMRLVRNGLIHMSCAIGKYEFQCLHLLGKPLYEHVVGKDKLDRPCLIYAPVGTHETK